MTLRVLKKSETEQIRFFCQSCQNEIFTSIDIDELKKFAEARIPPIDWQDLLRNKIDKLKREGLCDICKTKIRNEQIKKQLQASLPLAGELESAEFENFDTTQFAVSNSYTYTKFFADNFIDIANQKEAYPFRILILCGDNGVGKSHLAISAAKKCIREGSIKTTFLFYANAMSDYFNSKDKFKYIDSILSKSLLILDDLKPQYRDSDFEKMFLHAIVDRVYNDKSKGMIITTEMTPARMWEFFSHLNKKAIESRIRHIGKAFELKAQDYRLKHSLVLPDL